MQHRLAFWTHSPLAKSLVIVWGKRDLAQVTALCPSIGSQIRIGGCSKIELELAELRWVRWPNNSTKDNKHVIHLNMTNNLPISRNPETTNPSRFRHKATSIEISPSPKPNPSSISSNPQSTAIRGWCDVSWPAVMCNQH